MKCFKLAFGLYAGMYAAQKLCPIMEKIMNRAALATAKSIYERYSADEESRDSPIIKELGKIVNVSQQPKSKRDVKITGFYTE